jgi:predicted lipid carrier protein YhbT
VATIKQCRSALDQLAATLDGVDPDLRTKHLPQRTVACRVRDLGVVFLAELDEDGVHNITVAEPAPDGQRPADVRLSLDSDDLVALAMGEDDFVKAWLHGRVQVSASVRDMLRLRSVLGL